MLIVPDQKRKNLNIQKCKKEMKMKYKYLDNSIFYPKSLKQF